MHATGAIVLTEDDPVVPRIIVSSKFEDARKALRSSLLNNSTCKDILKAIKVTGGLNTKLATKHKMLAVKMVQRQFCVQGALTLVAHIETRAGVSGFRICLLSSTSVRVTKTITGEEKIFWGSEDVPIFNGKRLKSDFLYRIPIKTLNVSGEAFNAREPGFEASEYCRLLHVLPDARMTTARTQLTIPKSREELDTEHVDPWTDHIAPIFNDSMFKPDPVFTLSGGVTRSDIAAIDPVRRPYVRIAGVLSRKFVEFKSLYGNCLARYEASGHNEPDFFVRFSDARSHFMHAFCFLKLNPVLEPLARRTLPRESQREEGVLLGTRSPEEDSRNTRRRRRERQEISIMGLEALSEVFKHFNERTNRRGPGR